MSVPLTSKKPHHHSVANIRSFYGLLLLVLLLSYLLLRPYLSLTFLAFITAWAFKDIYHWLYSHLRQQTGIAVGLTVLLVYLTILFPLAIFINIGIQQAVMLSKDINNLVIGRSLTINTVVASVNQTLSQIPGLEYQVTQVEVLDVVEDVARPAGNYVLEKAISLGGSTPDMIARTVLFTIILITFLPQSDRFISYLKQLSPLDDDLNDLYIRRILAMTSSMIKGTLVVAVAQSLLATFILGFVGVNYLFILFVLMVILGIIPVVGSTTVMVPIGIFMLLTGNLWQGLLVILSGVIVISNLDNVLRPLLVSKEAMISPALIILGVFGGISMFGILGVVFGPVLMIIMITTLEIYSKYYPIRKKSK